MMLVTSTSPTISVSTLMPVSAGSPPKSWMSVVMLLTRSAATASSVTSPAIPSHRPSELRPAPTPASPTKSRNSGSGTPPSRPVMGLSSPRSASMSDRSMSPSSSPGAISAWAAIISTTPSRVDWMAAPTSRASTYSCVSAGNSVASSESPTGSAGVDSPGVTKISRLRRSASAARYMTMSSGSSAARSASGSSTSVSAAAIPPARSSSGPKDWRST